MLIPKFKWNWADSSDIDSLKEKLKITISNFIDKSEGEYEANTVVNENDDFLEFEELYSPNTVLNSATNILQEYISFPKNQNINLFPYPAFKKAYIKYNSAIPSSAHVERLFSAGGQLLEQRRGATSDRNFEITLLLKFNKYFL